MNTPIPHKHRWNTRRCIDYTKYKDEDAAKGSQYFVYGLQKFYRVPCPHCNGWHLVDTFRITDAVLRLEQLPPLFPVFMADPLRSNGSFARQSRR